MVQQVAGATWVQVTLAHFLARSDRDQTAQLGCQGLEQVDWRALSSASERA